MMFVFSYSGADIAVVCREALLRPIRRLGSATHFKRVGSLRSSLPVNELYNFNIGTKSKG